MGGRGDILEHVKHSLGDHETTENVNGGDKHTCSSEDLRGGVGEEATAHEVKARDGHDTGDGVCHGHQGRMEGRSDSPDHLFSYELRSRKGEGKKKRRRMRDKRPGEEGKRGDVSHKESCEGSRVCNLFVPTIIYW